MWARGVEPFAAPADLRDRSPQGFDGFGVMYAADDRVGRVDRACPTRPEIRFIEEENPLAIVGSLEQTRRIRTESLRAVDHE